jgi:hypothetical protein
MTNWRKFGMLWSKISLTGRDISSHGIEVRRKSDLLWSKISGTWREISLFGVGIRPTGETLS